MGFFLDNSEGAALSAFKHSSLHKDPNTALHQSVGHNYPLCCESEASFPQCTCLLVSRQQFRAP